MGTFHFIDGELVKVFYRGNQKTCGFCHKTARVETGDEIPGTKVLEAVNKVQFSTSKEKVFGNPLYCRILKDLTPSKELVEMSEASNGSPSTNIGSKSKLLRTPILSLG